MVLPAQTLASHAMPYCPTLLPLTSNCHVTSFHLHVPTMCNHTRAAAYGSLAITEAHNLLDAGELSWRYDAFSEVGGCFASIDVHCIQMCTAFTLVCIQAALCGSRIATKSRNLSIECWLLLLLWWWWALSKVWLKGALCYGIGPLITYCELTPRAPALPP